MASNSFKNKIFSFISVTFLALGLFLSSMGSTSVKAADSNIISVGYNSLGTYGTYEGIANQRYSDVLVSAFNSLSLENGWIIDGSDLDEFFDTFNLRQYLDYTDSNGIPQPRFYINVSSLEGTSFKFQFSKPRITSRPKSLVYSYDGSSYLTFSARGIILPDTTPLRLPIFTVLPNSSTSNALGNYKYCTATYIRNDLVSNPSAAHTSTWKSLISAIGNNTNVFFSSASNYSWDGYAFNTWFADDSKLFGFGSYTPGSSSFSVWMRSDNTWLAGGYPFDVKNSVTSVPVFYFDNQTYYSDFYGIDYYSSQWAANINIKSLDNTKIVSDQEYIKPLTDGYYSYIASPWATPTPLPTREPIITPTPFPTYIPSTTITPIPNYVYVDTNVNSGQVISALSIWTGQLNDFLSTMTIVPLCAYLIDYMFSFSPYFSFLLIVPLIGLIAYVIGRLNQK